MSQTFPRSVLTISDDAPWRPEQALPATTTAHCEAVKRVIEVMHERLDAPLSLHDMSRIAYISPYHFNRVFHQITGIPPCQFLYALRLETAKRLLLTTHGNVTDICFDVGYNSLGTFIRRFTGLVGISPSRFRSLAHAAPTAAFEQTAPPPDAAKALSNLGIVGRATAPEGFKGAIFIGLFTTPIPQGGPIAGTSITQPGIYRIAPVPDGQYYILAAGLAASADPKEYFLYESSLRGGGQAIQIRGGEVKGSADLSLRPPTPFDPPILLTLPLLLAESRMRTAHA